MFAIGLSYITLIMLRNIPHISLCLKILREC
jgi:hypothetical protein